MDVIEDFIEDMDINRNIEDLANDVTAQTKIQSTADFGESPIKSECLSTTKILEEVELEIEKSKTLLHSKSLPGLEVQTNSPLSRGDGATADKFSDAIASTSRVVVKRRRKPRVCDVLRPILPRKSKDKAKEILKIMARGRGIVLPRGVLKRVKAGRLDVRTQRIEKRRKRGKKPLMTVWARDRRDRSPDSCRSECECSCACY